MLQLKRNPFIDHPEFVDRIYSFAANNVRPIFSELNVLPLKVDFDSTLINNTTSKQIYIANSGSAQLIIDSVTITDSRFTLNIVSFSIEPYSSKKVLLQFNPDSIKNYNASITLYSSGGVKEIILTGIGKDNTVDVENEINTPLSYSLEQNYPNPFNPSTKIIWQSPVGSWQTLKVYDILGNEVVTLVNEYRDAGKYEIDFNPSSIKYLPTSGVYFYRLQVGSFVETKKMIYLK